VAQPEPGFEPDRTSLERKLKAAIVGASTKLKVDISVKVFRN
jgi:hypothetical protein